MTEPARLYFLRHGQTTWNADGNRYAGASDVPLTEIGIQQARQGAEQIRDLQFDAIYCSGMSRAFETAKLALDGRDAPIVQDTRLNEMNYGDWEGKTHAEILAEPGNHWHDWAADPDAWRPASMATGERGGGAGDRVSSSTCWNRAVRAGGRAPYDGRLLIAHLLELPGELPAAATGQCSLSLRALGAGDIWRFINRV